MEKVDGQLQVFVGEVEAFRPRLPGLQGDHSCHIALGDTQELEGLITNVIGRGKGQGKQIVETMEGLLKREGGQQCPIEGAVAASVSQSLLQLPQLVPTQGLPGQSVCFLQADFSFDPVFKRRDGRRHER
jgi:hypothetical protein